MSDQKKKTRLSVIIYPRFQFTLFLANAAIIAIAFVSIGVQAVRSYSKLAQIGAGASLPPDHAYFKFVDLQAQALYTHLGVAAGISVLASLVITLVISHRLAGPLVRLKNHFKGIVDTGEVKAVQFRKGDYFQDLPPLVNEAFDQVKVRRDRAS